MLAASMLMPMLVLSSWGRGSYLLLAEETVEHGYQILGFIACAAAIWLGIRRDWRETVNAAVAFFVLFLYVRYFDWWWEVIPRYLFFLLLGLTAVVILLVLRRVRGGGAGPLGEALAR